VLTELAWKYYFFFGGGGGWMKMKGQETHRSSHNKGIIEEEISDQEI
jgi:hypothetical protein